MSTAKVVSYYDSMLQDKSVAKKHSRSGLFKSIGDTLQRAFDRIPNQVKIAGAIAITSIALSMRSGR